MIVATTLFGLLYGCIVGLVWALALNLSYRSGLFYGLIIGGSLALIFAINQKIAEIRVKRELRGRSIAFGNLFLMILIVGVIIGLFVWGVRIVFFI